MYPRRAGLPARGSQGREGLPDQGLLELEAGLQQPRGPYPVSYTHLDVYKRQALTYVAVVSLTILSTGVMGLLAVLSVQDEPVRVWGLSAADTATYQNEVDQYLSLIHI